MERTQSRPLIMPRPMPNRPAPRLLRLALWPLWLLAFLAFGEDARLEAARQAGSLHPLLH